MNLPKVIVEYPDGHNPKFAKVRFTEVKPDGHIHVCISDNDIDPPTLTEQKGYHTKHIPRGELGLFSKIKEEFLELEDGYEQNNPILVLCELSDIIGAIKYFAKNYNVTLGDLVKMSEATESAFLEGKR